MKVTKKETSCEAYVFCHEDGDGYGCHVWFCEKHGSLLLLVKTYT